MHRYLISGLIQRCTFTSENLCSQFRCIHVACGALRENEAVLNNGMLECNVLVGFS